MKSSYHLLGIYLDRVPLPEKKPEIIDLQNLCYVWDICEDYNLFDYPVCRRKISGSQLLSANTLTDYENHLNLIKECKELIVTPEYRSRSRVACRLYVKRMLQALYLLLEHHPYLAVIIAVDDESIIEEISTLYH